MANLTSTAPLAFETLYNLINTTAQAQNPPVVVFNQELLQYEPNSYVVLSGIESHRFEWAALGSFAFYEYYDIAGFCTVWQGNTDTSSIITSTYDLYQNVVQSTVVANRAPPLSADLIAAGLLEILPGFARYSGEQGVNQKGGPMGFYGRIDFSYSCKGRITV